MRLRYQTPPARDCQAEILPSDVRSVWVVAAPQYAKTDETLFHPEPNPETVGVTVPPVRCTCGKLLQPPPSGGFRCPFCGQTFQAAITPAAAPAAIPATVTVTGAVMAPGPQVPGPQVPPPNPELEQLDSRPIRRRSGTPITRILLWVLMTVFLTVPLVFMGVYVMHKLRQWDKELRKIPRAAEIGRASCRERV